jgi:hypothetical protein
LRMALIVSCRQPEVNLWTSQAFPVMLDLSTSAEANTHSGVPHE